MRDHPHPLRFKPLTASCPADARPDGDRSEPASVVAFPVGAGKKKGKAQ
ncbi:MAG TPA: hypothetical protein VGQ10_16840 [Vicinamibacterales bacterium]|nr:hypothetical protein [Vicinamibacterales bacterium]